METCPSDNIVTGKDFTGTYYLWILLTTETGKTNICVSEGFNFDNEGPTVELTSTPTTDSSFTLTATASDNKSGIAKYEFYVDDIKVDTQETTKGTAIHIWNGSEMVENKECFVVAIDNLGNISKKYVKARTKLHLWEKWDIIQTQRWEMVKGEFVIQHKKNDSPGANVYGFDVESRI